MVDRKITPDPMFPIHLGPKYRLVVDKDDEEWLGLPPGKYKLMFEGRFSDHGYNTGIYNLIAIRENKENGK